MILVVEINVGYLTKKSDHYNIDKIKAKHVTSSQLCCQMDNVFYYLKIFFSVDGKK